ncbi:hypothetical protein [Enterococcus faecium]|nr:hypothetical protein [Enterococcus faecium]MDW3702869.1 hypothetical protein [Enterococcus faecium]
MITVKALPAYDGDCLIVQYGEEDQRTNLFVDGGQGQQVVRQLKEEIATISQKGECIDLLVLTHIDADHIRGFLSLFSQSSFDKSCIKRVFFNSRKLLSQKFDTKVVYDDQLEIVQEKSEISFKQGESFDRYLENLRIEKMTVIDNSCQPKLLNGAKMTILTPDEASLRKLLDHEIKQQKKKKIGLEAKLGKIKLTLTKLFSLLNLDDHQLSQKDYSKDPDYSFLLEQISQLDDIWQERKKLEVDLTQKKKERSSLEDLGSQLEQLKKLGYSIVTDTSSSVCPLCLHDHQEFQHIIQKIEASTADLLPIEQLTKEISHLEGMIDESTRRLTEVVSGVKQQIQIQITVKETEINQLDQDLLQVTLKLKQQEEAYLTNEKHWYKLNEYSQKYGIDCEKIAEETQKRVKSLQEELVKLTNEYQNIKEKINQNEQLNVKPIRQLCEHLESF